MKGRHLHFASQLILLFAFVDAHNPGTNYCQNDYPYLHGDNPDCFHFVYEYLTWRKATDFCATELSSELLVMQPDKHIGELLTSHGRSESDNVWILSKSCRFNTTLDVYNYRGNGEEDNDVQLAYEHFVAHNMFDPEGDELCYYLQHQPTYKKCSTMEPPCDLADFPFVCKYSRSLAKSAKDETTYIPIGNPTRNNCRSENELEFQIFPTPTDWVSAEKICMGIGGHLVAIHDDYTISNLLIMLRNLSDTNSVWIGLTQTPDGLTWSDRSPFDYRQNLIGYDDVKNPKCARMNKNVFGLEQTVNVEDGSWNITSCDIQHPFVCQYCTTAKNQGAINLSNKLSSVTIGIVVFIVFLIASCVYIAHRRGAVVTPLSTTAFWNGKWLTFIGYQKAENEGDMNDLLKCENSEFSIE